MSRVGQFTSGRIGEKFDIVVLVTPSCGGEVFEETTPIDYHFPLRIPPTPLRVFLGFFCK